MISKKGKLLKIKTEFVTSFTSGFLFHAFLFCQLANELCFCLLRQKASVLLCMEQMDLCENFSNHPFCVPSRFDIFNGKIDSIVCLPPPQTIACSLHLFSIFCGFFLQNKKNRGFIGATESFTCSHVKQCETCVAKIRAFQFSFFILQQSIGNCQSFHHNFACFFNWQACAKWQNTFLGPFWKKFETVR